MSKADYEFIVEDGIVKIIDLDLGGMSVTNDIENVLTEIQKQQNIKGLEIIYKDSMGNWDKVIPNWLGGKCIDVNFSSL